MSAQNKRVRYDYPDRVQLITIIGDDPFLPSPLATYASSSPNMRRPFSRRTLAQLVLICAGLPTASVAQTQEPRADLPTLVRETGRAVVMIVTYGQSGQELSFGSGFLLSDGRVVTNTHVVEGASRVEIFDSQGQLLGTSQYAENLSSRVDIAVLPRMGSVPGALGLSASTPAVGESVIVIGAPEGLTNTVSTGIVSAFRAIGGQRLMQISAPISPGSSGGPVLNLRGEVVGVSVSGLERGQNLNFAVPVADVRAIVTSPRGRIAFPAASGSASPATNEERNTSITRISVGQSVRGSLQPTDTRLDDGRYADVYAFTANRGQILTITLASSDLNSRVQVLQARGDKYAEIGRADTNGGGTDAHLAVTLPTDGEYLLGVISAERGGTGAYTLSLASGSSSEITTPPTDQGVEDVPSRWVRIGPTRTAVLYFDGSRIAPQGNGTYRIWERSDYGLPQRNHLGARYDLLLVEEDIDCVRRRTRIVSLAQYHRRDVVHAMPAKSTPRPWDEWTPGSPGEAVGERVCEYVRGHGI